jgi:multidrug efflux pump subunit AcrA (membrane-fusion protein)
MKRRVRRIAFWIALAAPPVLLGALGAAAYCAEPAVVASRGLISLIDDVQVPAHRAGIVKTLTAKEGHHVKKDAPLAQIDVEQAALEAAVARAEKEAAIAKAESDVDTRYATATHSVSVAEHKGALEANKKVSEAVSQVEVDRLRLTMDQAFLKIEASNHEQRVKRTESRAYAARESLAELNVRQRTALAPIDGEIAEVFVHAGEWIEPGKPLCRIVGLEHLRVETFVRVADRLPKELFGRSASVRVVLARGVAETFDGKVTFVSPIVQPGGDYRVWIELTNRRDGEQWLLRPGLEAEVTIAK